MKFWLDCEFLENGVTIDLISIGIVAEDGRECYHETTAAKGLCAQSEWLTQNVAPHLENKPRRSGQIGIDIIHFCGENPEFWGYCSAYDWVCLCQLYGTMMGLPQGWPFYCRDIQQLKDDLPGAVLPPPLTPQHHALVDARWTREAWLYLKDYQQAGGL